jgi:hypothetical protein
MEYLFVNMWMWELAALAIGLVTGWVSCTAAPPRK